MSIIRVNFAAGTSGALLGTALVQILLLDNFYPARALKDSGSKGTFISEMLFRLLKIDFGSNLWPK